jgi:putative tricarboxylic transport membrane protein
MTKQPELFWGMIASMWIGNAMLIVINLPMVGLWVRLLRVPYRHLFPMIMIFCCIGIYSVNNAPFDVFLTAIYAIVGYWLAKHDFEPAPMILGFVLGPLMEENLRRAMLIARGDATVFITRPISATLLGISALMLQARRGLHGVTVRPDRLASNDGPGGRHVLPGLVFVEGRGFVTRREGG